MSWTQRMCPVITFLAEIAHTSRIYFSCTEWKQKLNQRNHRTQWRELDTFMTQHIPSKVHVGNWPCPKIAYFSPLEQREIILASLGVVVYIINTWKARCNNCQSLWHYPMAKMVWLNQGWSSISIPKYIHFAFPSSRFPFLILIPQMSPSPQLFLLHTLFFPISLLGMPLALPLAFTVLKCIWVIFVGLCARRCETLLKSLLN